MIFAEEFGPVAIGTVVVSVLAAVGGGLMTLMNWRKANRQDKRKEGIEDENALIARFERQLDRQQKEYDDGLAEQGRRIESLDRRVSLLMDELDRHRMRAARSAARIIYLETKLRESGVKFEVWDISVGGVPADHHTPPHGS